MTVQLILEFVVGIALIIILHEIGHFIACRLLKIEVEEFGIGLPPRAVTLFEVGGTKFTLNWLPLGGFVRPKGENDPDVEGGLAASPAWKRIVVYFAGPFMNVISAILLFAIIVSMLGKTDPTQMDQVTIGAVSTDSPAAQAGLLKGDLLLTVNGQRVTSTEMVHDTIYASLEKEMEIVYQRDGQVITVYATPRSNPPPNQGALGILMTTPTLPVGPLEALQGGVKMMGSYLQNLTGAFGRLFSGTASPQEGRVVGFKGMYDMYSNVRSAEPVYGLPWVIDPLYFFASLSVWLGLINLAPIPALDGGRIVLTLPEIIIRRRVPPKVETFMIGISFIILIALMLAVNLRDFIAPATIP
jgi:regulator of sigma E protease